jgi:hypothetical protein
VSIPVICQHNTQKVLSNPYHNAKALQNATHRQDNVRLFNVKNHRRANFKTRCEPFTPPHFLSNYPWASMAESHSNRPFFITARFHGGPTLLWRLVRECQSISPYYEPLNERQWFTLQYAAKDLTKATRR